MLLLDFDHHFFKHFLYADHQRETIHEDIQGRQNLLVTIGDSWTWGDSLCGIVVEDGIYDNPERTNLVYGAHMRDNLGNYDWINIGYPGTANLWIVDVAARFIELKKKLDYAHILVVCTLTDITRDVNTLNELDKQENNSTLLDLAERTERHRFNTLSKLDHVDGLDLIVARNFTHTFPKNQRLVKHHVDSEWIELNRKEWNSEWEEFPFFAGYEWLPRQPNLLADQKRWCVEEGFPASQAIVDFLDACPLHYKKATKHPTEESHYLWANYLTKYFKQMERR